MRARGTARVAGTVAWIAMAAAPVASHAQGVTRSGSLSVERTVMHAEPPPAAPVVISVPREEESRSTVTREVQSDCNYRSAIRGGVQPVTAPGPAGETLYAPHVTVDASLACAGNPTERAVHTSIAGAPLSARALTDAVSAAAAMSTADSGALCTFRPVVTLEQGELRAGSIEHSCNSARGGGPASGPSIREDAPPAAWPRSAPLDRWDNEYRNVP